MSRALLPCPGCERHLRAGEAVCPFCGRSEPTRGLAPRAEPHPLLSRAAQLAFTVTLAGATSMRCSSAQPGGPIWPGGPVSAGMQPVGAADASASVVDAHASADVVAERTALVAIYGDSVVMILERVYFGVGSVKIDEKHDATLAAVAEVLGRHPFVVEVEGHADASEKGWQLAKRRADAVRKDLIRRGVDPERLVVKDHGATQPLDPKQPEQNARVSFRVIEVDGGPPP